MNRDLYLLIENLPSNGGFALTNPQRNTLLTAIQQLGQSYLYMAPVRNDNQAAVFEARFRSGDILDFGWKARLGTLFSINPLMIDVFENPASYGGGISMEYVFSYLGTDYFRVILFGTIAGTKLESAAECRDYLALHAADWAAP